LQAKRDTVIRRLSKDLQDDKVVTSVLKLLVTHKSEASYSVRLKLQPNDAATNSEIAKAIDESRPAKLYASDFQNLHKKLVSLSGATHPSRVLSYESSYFKGQFVDRFGINLPKPTLSLTISDQDMGGVLTAFLEALADELFSTTPVWIDDNSTTPVLGEDNTIYYPGGNTNKPTFLTFPGAPATVKLVDSGCGMTKLKMDALTYLSGKAATWAAGQTGFILGSFGGVNGGPVIVLGKLSIGDNKTLETVAQTILSNAAKRATFEGVKDLLLNIDQPKDWTLGELLDKLVFGKA
jgi:hypothetical protein